MIKTCCHGTVPDLMGSDVDQGSREKRETWHRDEQRSCRHPHRQWAAASKRPRPGWSEFCSTLRGRSKGDKAGPCSLTPPRPGGVPSPVLKTMGFTEPHAAGVQEPRQLVKWDLSEPRALSPTTWVTQAHRWGLPSAAQVSTASYARRKVATQGWTDMLDYYLRYGNRYHKVVKFKLCNIQNFKAYGLTLPILVTVHW